MKIPEYSRHALASSLVGVPQADQSGEIIAEGVQRGVQGVAVVLGERQKKIDDLEASVQIQDFSSKLYDDEFKAESEVEDFTKYPEEMRKRSKEIQNQMAQGLQGGVKERFLATTQNILTQREDNWFSYVDKKTIQRAKGGAINLFSKIAVRAASLDNPDQFKQFSSAAFGAAIQKTSGILSPESVIALDAKYKEAALTGHLDNRLLKDPIALDADLLAGKYDIGGTEVEKWRSRIKGQKIAIGQRAQLENAHMNLDVSNDLLTLHYRGDMSLPMTEYNIESLIEEKKKLYQQQASTTDPILKDKLQKDIQSKSQMQAIYEAARYRIINEDIKNPKQDDSQGDKIIAEWTDMVRRNESDDASEVVDVLEKYTTAWRLWGEGVLSYKKFQEVQKVMHDTLKDSNKSDAQETTISAEKALEKVSKKGLYHSWQKGKNTGKSIVIDEIYRRVAGQLKGKKPSERGKIMIPFISKALELYDNMPDNVAQLLQSGDETKMRQGAKYLLDGQEGNFAGVMKLMTKMVDEQDREIEVNKPYPNQYGYPTVCIGKDNFTGKLIWVAAPSMGKKNVGK